jgi:glycosyltransferase involved in cell wall biosynthesis
LSSPVGRRQFGIPELAYAFLFFFDFSSYVDRKNPFGTIEAFARLRNERPSADLCLILKTNTANAKPADRRRFEAAVGSLSGHLHVIDETLTDNETKNLVHCCDCFVSLHRSEGFGHGLSEAMFLGKPVIATRYSGNLDFMNDENSFLVDCDLVPVGKDQYVFSEGQVWAEPRIDQAVGFMGGLVDRPDEGRRRGRVASRHIRQFFSYRAMGLRYRARLEHVAQVNRLAAL